HRAPRSAEFGQPHLLQENHLDVAAPLRGRAVERISELLDLAAHSVFFKSGGDDGQPIRQPLSLPGSGKILPRVAEIEGDKKAFEFAIVVAHFGKPVHAELVERAVPGEADDVTG